MARTGHRVMCWNQDGELCEPKLTHKGWKVEIGKEAIHVTKGKSNITIKHGSMEVDGIIILAHYCECRARLFFYIEAKGKREKFIYGIAKFEETKGLIDEYDIKEFGIWLTSVIFGVHPATYYYFPSIANLADHDKVIRIMKSLKKIKDFKKIDLGDLVFTKGKVLYKYPYFVHPPAIMYLLIGLGAEETDKYVKRIEKVMKKLAEGKPLTKRERDFVLGVLFDAQATYILRGL